MLPETRETDEETEFAKLIARARRGEADALERLLMRCAPRIATFSSQQISTGRVGHQRPSDIAQESALRAFQRFHTFSGNTAPELDAWLRRIVARRVAQAARDARRLKRDDGKTVSIADTELRSEQATPSQSVAAAEEWRRVLALLFELPEAQREAIWLCHLREMPVSEVARQLGRTEGSVAGHIHRGLRSLHQQFMQRERTPHNDEAGELLDEQVTSGLLEYLRGRELGHPTNLELIVARHPGSATELRLVLDWVQRLDALRSGSTEPTRQGAP